MAVFVKSIQGNARNTIEIGPVIQGSQNPYVQHSYQGLTECSCMALDRFNVRGKAIRTAYEKAVVEAVSTFYPSRDSVLRNKAVNIVVIGSGGLLQEAFWLKRLYSILQPSELTIHLVDTDYATNISPLENFVNYVGPNIVPFGTVLNIFGWRSCEELRPKILKPDLVIGMDTERATPDAKRYQWALQSGDLEKVLIVRWESTSTGDIAIRLHSRKGSSDQLREKQFVNFDEAAQAIETAGIIPL